MLHSCCLSIICFGRSTEEKASSLMYHDQNMLTILMPSLLNHHSWKRRISPEDENVASERHPRRAVALGLAEEVGNSSPQSLQFPLISLRCNMVEAEEIGRTFQTYFVLVLVSQHASRFRSLKSP